MVTDGRGRAVDPTNHPREKQSMRFDCQPVDEHERVRTEEIWDNLAPNHCLKAFNRERRAGQPASSKQVGADQQEGDEVA
eukprot:7610516-Pyramimonas_sp.AAC.1